MTTWIRDTAGRQYTLTQGDYLALVMRHSTGEWLALISQRKRAVHHTRCRTLKVALTWCETRLAQLATDRR